MPDTIKEGEFKGKPTISILTGIGRDGKEFGLRWAWQKRKPLTRTSTGSGCLSISTKKGVYD